MSVINLTDVAKNYAGISHQDDALAYLQSKLDPDVLKTFAGIWRGNPQATGAITLKNVCIYYKGLTFQDNALNYLQTHIPSDVLTAFADRWRSAPIYVTLDQLYKSTTVATAATLSPFVSPLNQGFEKFGLTSKLRRCHFLAQIIHESGEFQFLEEIADGSEYEGRDDLGNTHPGDGPRYKGRGVVQITGRYNYDAVGKALGHDFINNPEDLAKLPYAIDSAFWYWNTHDLNSLADRDDVVSITKVINGGTNGIDQREQYLTFLKANLK